MKMTRFGFLASLFAPVVARKLPKYSLPTSAISAASIRSVTIAAASIRSGTIAAASYARALDAHKIASIYSLRHLGSLTKEEIRNL